MQLVTLSVNLSKLSRYLSSTPRLKKQRRDVVTEKMADLLGEKWKWSSLPIDFMERDFEKRCCDWKIQIYGRKRKIVSLQTDLTGKR